ncbi:hypothetical protein H351_31725 (plasmid) [Rhodococcus erythropolis R138]|nr:hypothetical protein H351_31725 [Rhodococcus erythropolis R138]
MFRNVHDPQLVRLLAREFTIDEIAHGRDLMLGTRTFVARKAFHTSSSHQQFDAAVSHDNAVNKGEFSVDPTSTVGSVGCHVDLGHPLCQPGMAQ